MHICLSPDSQLLHRTHHSNLCPSKISITLWHGYQPINVISNVKSATSHPLCRYSRISLPMWYFARRASEWDSDVNLHTHTRDCCAIWTHLAICSVSYLLTHYSILHTFIVMQDPRSRWDSATTEWLKIWKGFIEHIYVSGLKLFVSNLAKITSWKNLASEC